MNFVYSALETADVVCLLIDATQKFGHGDEYVLETLAQGQDARSSSSSTRWTSSVRTRSCPSSTATRTSSPSRRSSPSRPSRASTSTSWRGSSSRPCPWRREALLGRGDLRPVGALPLRRDRPGEDPQVRHRGAAVRHGRLHRDHREEGRAGLEEARRDAAPDLHPGLGLRREGQPPQDHHRPPRLAHQADRHRSPTGDRGVRRSQGLPGAPGPGPRELARLRGRPRPHRRPEGLALRGHVPLVRVPCTVRSVPDFGAHSNLTGIPRNAIIYRQPDGECSSTVRASDCGSEGWGFDSPHSPHLIFQYFLITSQIRFFFL